MEIIVRATAAALAASAICLMLRRTNPELSLMIGICAAAVILSASLRAFTGISELTEAVRTMTGVSGKYITPVLKCTVISITTKIGTSICRDASQSAAASGLELAGTVCALNAAMPLIISMLGMIGDLV